MNYRNAKFNRFGTIDCEIEHETYGWIPFTCDPKDTGAAFDTSELYDVMFADPETISFTPLTQEELDEEQAKLVRSERYHLLTTQVDVIAGNALRWAALTDEKKQEWADYRQALLDVPDQAGFPNEVEWPAKPE